MFPPRPDASGPPTLRIRGRSTRGPPPWRPRRRGLTTACFWTGSRGAPSARCRGRPGILRRGSGPTHRWFGANLWLDAVGGRSAAPSPDRGPRRLLDALGQVPTHARVDVAVTGVDRRD